MCGGLHDFSTASLRRYVPAPTMNLLIKYCTYIPIKIKTRKRWARN